MQARAVHPATAVGVALLAGLGLAAVGVLLVVLGADATPPVAVDAERRGAVATEVDVLATELDDWWDGQLAALGHPPLDSPRITDGGDGVACDGEPVRVDEDLVENAWAGICSEGTTVAYDPALFSGDPLATALTMAHEWGHLVQYANERFDASLVDGALLRDGELQADCFAGAWWADARPDGDLALAVADVRATGDPPGTPLDDPDGHGSGDERSRAFLAGHRGGVAACLPG